MQISANVNYHIHSADRQAYLIDAGGVPGKLVSPVQDRQTVAVRDLRSRESEVRFSRDSLAFVKSPSVEEAYQDDNAWQDGYDRQLADLLKKEIGVNHVALNLRFNQADAEETLKRLAGTLLAEFPAHETREI